MTESMNTLADKCCLCFQASSVPWAMLQRHLPPAQICPVHWILQSVLETYLLYHITALQLTAFPQQGSKTFCWKLNYHLLVLVLWTWWTASSVCRKAAGTLFSSFLSRLNTASSLELSSCCVFSILLIILLLLRPLSRLFLCIYL